MSRFMLIVALAGGLVCVPAAADPVKNALRVRIPFGGGDNHGDRVVWDVFEINKTLDRIQDRRDVDARPTVVLDRESIEAHREHERQLRMQDPNLVFGEVGVATGDLRPELRPADKKALFNDRIRVNGNPSTPITDPFRSTVSTTAKTDR